MPQPIILQDLSGIAEGITSATSALAKGLEKREEKKLSRDRNTVLQNVLQNIPENFSLSDIRKASADLYKANIPADEISKGLSLFTPILKEKEKAKGQTDFLSSIGLGALTQNQQQATPVAPEAAPNVPQETPNVPQPLDATNALANGQPNPEPGLQPTPIMAPTQFQDSIEEQTVQGPGGQPISKKQAQLMIASPYEGVRRLGESIDKDLQQQELLRFKENVQVRKEHRERINKYAEPFSDVIGLRGKVNRLEAVNDLIANDSASFDNAFWRSASAALLEDRGDFAVSEIFKTPAQQKMYALLRPFFGAKELGGSNPSTREVLLSMSALPGHLKGKDANEYIGLMLSNEANTLLDQAKIVNELRDKNIPWGEFQSKVNERIAPIQQERNEELESLQKLQMAREVVKGRKPASGTVFMMSPQGNIKEVKKSDVKSALKSRGKLINGK